MTPLTAKIAAIIDGEGPIALSRYMALALGDEQHGYYQCRDPFGPEGDFVTAPEISQMFGELIGLWVAERWLAMGKPAAFNLIELGPGRGTLLTDALRATAIVPGFGAAAQIHCVEISTKLRTLQRQKLPVAQWHKSLADVCEGPFILIANEFFDALPIDQLQRVENGWRQRRVTRDGEGFVFILDHDGEDRSQDIPPTLRDAAIGSIFEIRPTADVIIAEIAQRLRTAPGWALIIDYGPAQSSIGDSLQAIRDQQSAAPLCAPGAADLTAHVDFQSLRREAQNHGLAHFGPVPQGEFLFSLGIKERADKLKVQMDAQQRSVIDAALTRLTHPAQMGTLFKVLALAQQNSPPPPGFMR